jgi:hypothetical protein
LKLSKTGLLAWLFQQAPVWLLFLLGLCLIVLRGLGAHLQNIPGDLVDARFNSYVLEHFFRWLTGLDRDFWNAAIFYPYRLSIAFSDNLLGSAPLYALFRFAGLDRIAAFQGWYLLSFCCNYLTSAYVLSRLKLAPLAIGVGAFFFTFGLPVLAQENHAQLLYRFCVPLACFFLWRFYEQPRLGTLVAVGFWLAWQFYLTIYIGIFLMILLAALAVLLPVFVPEPRLVDRLTLWPRRLWEAWLQSSQLERLLTGLAILALGAGLVALLVPYRQASVLYNFYRDWSRVSSALPKIQSYLQADRSLIWQPDRTILAIHSGRNEQQLFLGAGAIGLILIGVVGRFRYRYSRLAWLNLTVAVALSLLTLDIHGFSFYRLLWSLPGMDSIRVISRIILVILWPLALFCAWSVSAVLNTPGKGWLKALMYLLIGLLVAESLFFDHLTFTRTEAEARLDAIRQQIPATLPQNPVLFVAKKPTDLRVTAEIDGMLVAQDLGWPTLNGYSGFFPPGYSEIPTCKQMRQRIVEYMAFQHIQDPAFYLDLIRRVVPINATDCNPVWWNIMP